MPWVLFAYREIPVETLEFFPFELLFSRTITGPLLLLKDAWLNASITVKSKKKSVVEFVLDRRERLRSSINLANIHADGQKKMSKIWYDKKARHRSFKSDDEVLALLPLPGKPLHIEKTWSD